MGVGLDRLLMLRKGIEDIRLLRAADVRIRSQMLDLHPYRVVSRMPPIVRDLSLARSGEVDAEGLGDAVRDALARDARSVESVEVLAATPAVELSPRARASLGMTEDQCNVLVRVVLRDPDRTLTSEMANQPRDRIYSHLHQGSAHQWAAPLKKR
jgi:phenylalanyl-tRNA synthetase alpha chain